MVIVPRKRERFDEVEREIESRGLTCVRKTAVDAAGGRSKPLAADEILLGDTMGELAKTYEAADFVFLGRSLVPFGGSDMLEPGALARPLVFGPHTENFPDLADELVASGGAVRLAGPEELAEVLGRIAEDGGLRREMGEKARMVIDRNRGATTRTMDLIFDIMEPAE